MRKLVLFFSYIILFPFYSSSQTRTVDSLKKQLQTVTALQEKLTLLLALCDQRNSLSGDTLYSYAAAAKRIATMLRQPEKALISDYNTW